VVDQELNEGEARGRGGLFCNHYTSRGNQDIYLEGFKMLCSFSNSAGAYLLEGRALSLTKRKRGKGQKKRRCFNSIDKGFIHIYTGW
jgi:hypothetical protein